jgi:tRNA (guanine6-N2)-methyltransferase
VRLLATTNGGLEAIAAEELRDIIGADASVHHRGVVEFDGNEADIYTLHYRARSLHRMMAVLVDGTVNQLQDVYELTEQAAIASKLPEEPFGVVGTRHGTHEFTSMDVADRVGQAVIDTYRDATGTRLPVDLDDPTVRLEAYLYDDRFTLAIDLTGDSLHKRPSRVCEHDAPLRSTLAYSMLRIAEYEPADRLVDPMAGSATIPIEAAMAAEERVPRPDLDPMFEALPEYDGERFRRLRAEHDADAAVPALDIEARDRREKWRRCARVNCDAAGVSGAVEIVGADAREEPLAADCVVTNLPFGIRVSEDLQSLYRAFSDQLLEGDVDRLVALTTAPELLSLEPTERYEIPYGRLDATIVVWER